MAFKPTDQDHEPPLIYAQKIDLDSYKTIWPCLSF